MTGGPAAEETVKFIVSTNNTGRHQRKIGKQPYRSGVDFRLKVQMHVYLATMYVCACACTCIVYLSVYIVKVHMCRSYIHVHVLCLVSVVEGEVSAVP